MRVARGREMMTRCCSIEVVCTLLCVTLLVASTASEAMNGDVAGGSCSDGSCHTEGTPLTATRPALTAETERTAAGGRSEATTPKSDAREIVENGWDPTYPASLDIDFCNIPKVKGLSVKDFRNNWMNRQAVILVDAVDNSKVRELTTRENLLKHYGTHNLTLSTANTFSYDKEHKTLTEYLRDYMVPVSLDNVANKTLYHFGDHKTEFGEWKLIFDAYNQPPHAIQPGGHGSAYSFGLGPTGSGVPFHFHGPGFSEVFHGRKVRAVMTACGE
eukprot:GFYU01007193.1.p1 GENE.GFYU01007193.1~~GFYU01007193.1.p1  ORF type:complete len:273 (+),score=54.87 GFYU01007193.1:98-916(+)